MDTIPEEWKSLFPISSVFKPPLLISNPSKLGPLIFNPKPNTTTLLFSSPSLLLPPLPPLPHLSLPRFLKTSSPYSAPLPSTSSSLASYLGLPDYKTDSLHPFTNRLEFLQLQPSNALLIFFPTGENSDQLGYLKLVVKVSNVKESIVNDVRFCSVETRCRFRYRILRVSVNPLPNLSKLAGDNAAPVTVGYLFGSSMYSVHWFVVRHGAEGTSVVSVADRVFEGCVVHACWSPHVPEECVVLLEDGALFLFDLESHLDRAGLNGKFRRTRLKVLWESSGYGGDRWLSCEFSWHPRVLVVARSDAVFLVDWRSDECSLTCLMKIETLHMYAPIEKEQFRVLSRASSDGFHFVLASDSFLLLCDVRKPLMPVLQWAHTIDKASYINVFRLSELRSDSKDDTYRWPSDSGFCIILGSFWNSEFSIFSYGPSFPMPIGSVASKFAELRKSFYAWELPSDLLLCGDECHCGSCLVREEFLRDALPEWIDWQHKKEIVLGFGIVNKELSSLLSEPDEFGGFTLIRLMSSGNLELQRYCASWDSIKEVEESHKLQHFKDHLLYSSELKEYKEYNFSRKLWYVELDYLCGYLEDNLDEVLDAKIKLPCKTPQVNERFCPKSHEILCKKLHECGFGQLGSSPAITIVVNDISLPATIHEVVLRRLWSELPLELLQLAFSNYPEFLEVRMKGKRVGLEFSAVPDLCQLPPFILRRPRKPYCRSNKWSKKVQRGDDVVGPVLPLPLLLTLHEFRNGCPNSEDQAGRFSVEAELSRRYQEVMQVASEMAFSKAEPEVTSLANDEEEEWFDSQISKPFFFYQPVATKRAAARSSRGKSLYKDDRFDTLISKVSHKKQTCNDASDSVGLELFDDLCPVELKFDACSMKFGSKEKKGYSMLKRQLVEWQNNFDSCKDFRCWIDSKSNI